MTRSFEDKVRHDSLVKMMVKYFGSLGYTAITADIDGYPTPNATWWKNKPQEQRIPDLTCYKNDPSRTLIILEAETCPTLTTEHTKEQWKLFSAHAKQNNGEFHVVVPKECSVAGSPISGQELVERIASELGITIDKIWWPKD